MIPIIKALQGTTNFFVVMAFLLGGATRAHYNLGLLSEPVPFYAALLQTYKLSVLGDFDLGELETQNDTVFVPDPNSSTTGTEAGRP